MVAFVVARRISMGHAKKRNPIPVEETEWIHASAEGRSPLSS